MSRNIKFEDAGSSIFLETVRERTKNYFDANKISTKADWRMVAKTIGLLLLWGLLYWSFLFANVPLFLKFIIAAGLGITMGLIGFNICHDALHGAYAKSPWKNKALGWLFNAIGANVYVWKMTHNRIHHTFTNIVGHDADLEVAPGIIRIHEDEPKKWIHRYQHVYAFFLYSLSSISWFFKKDYMKFFDKSLRVNGKKPPRIEYFNLFFFKLVYYAFFLIIPLLVMEVAWWQVLLLLLVMHLAEGTLIGNVFQLAHLVEETNMPNPKQNAEIHDSWAIHQMRTTANFARGNPLAGFLFGGLNYQIEHHLFPNVCHVHYPDISVIVKATAEEFDVPYLENETFSSALKSHSNFLQKMGRPKKTEELLSAKV
ncbi:acyl-CoA desaturase [Cecembia sp.]|uniref:fatty acid desaturase family protein n=1 Tax=Cecembia sp. TaxID=1898110 RepID=UPI0025B94D78|nr:acyl-CoA desaturase [Cecembia sp.]